MDERLEQEVNLLHASICQALADPKRILILYSLHEGPMSVTELTEQLDVPQPTVSRHLKVLRERRLVVTERKGTSVRYSLHEGPMSVTELTEQLDVPQPTVSRHLKVLRERRLVVTERKGTSVLYSLADDRVIDALDTMRAVLMGGINQTACLLY